MKKLITFLLVVAILIPLGKAQSSKTSKLIPTTLPVVYREDNTFFVLKGLDTLQREKVWGISLNGLFIKKTLGTCRWNDAASGNWYDIKQFVESMTFNKKKGKLPPLAFIKKDRAGIAYGTQVSSTPWGGKDEEAFNNTVEVLTANGITADKYSGYLWCSDEIYYTATGHEAAEVFSVIFGSVKSGKYENRRQIRIAVLF